jgi:hypothetical protein
MVARLKTEMLLKVNYRCVTAEVGCKLKRKASS